MQLIDLAYLVVYSIILYCSLLWLAVFLKNRDKMFENPRPKRFPSITFLVPAYNEEKTIAKCLKAILKLNYPKEKLKIIVIDDGSTDKTAKIVRKFKKVKLITQKNAGKAVALNNGLKHVKTELVACMDADSYPEKDYLIKTVGYLEKRSVGVVTPALKIIKTDSLIQKIQWVEYLWSIFLRKLFSFFDCQHVAPGPGSVYKTSVLKKIGGFDEKNITEDMEVAFNIIKHGNRLENSIDAYVYTKAPKNFWSLYRQRLRWYRGYIQNVAKYSHMIANPNYGNLGFFLLPMNFFWMFIISFIFFSTIFNWITIASQNLINWSYIGYGIMSLEIKFDVFLIDFYSYFWFLFLVIGLLLIWLSIFYSGERLDLKKKFSFYLSYIIFYPFMISIFWIAAIIYELLGMKRKW